MKIAARPVARHPCVQEWRMLRVLAYDALANAVLRGFDRVSFHGYCIEARPLSTSGADVASVELMLTIDGDAELLDRVRIAVAFRLEEGSACRIDHSHAPATAARRAESLAGCVSPVDARYASPETGQIS